MLFIFDKMKRNEFDNYERNKFEWERWKWKIMSYEWKDEWWWRRVMILFICAWENDSFLLAKTLWTETCFNKASFMEYSTTLFALCYFSNLEWVNRFITATYFTIRTTSTTNRTWHNVLLTSICNSKKLVDQSSCVYKVRKRTQIKVFYEITRKST